MTRLTHLFRFILPSSSLARKTRSNQMQVICTIVIAVAAFVAQPAKGSGPGYYGYCYPSPFRRTYSAQIKYEPPRNYDLSRSYRYARPYFGMPFYGLPYRYFYYPGRYYYYPWRYYSFNYRLHAGPSIYNQYTNNQLLADSPYAGGQSLVFRGNPMAPTPPMAGPDETPRDESGSAIERTKPVSRATAIPPNPLPPAQRDHLLQGPTMLAPGSLYYGFAPYSK